MKKILLFLLLLLPITVYADNSLYDVLKNEAESNGLAREYTGEHHDSFTEEPSKKIYHWYYSSESDMALIKEKENVLFAGLCWKIIRTTDTGGVKMMYSGEINSHGVCDDSFRYSHVQYNQSAKSIGYSGYMYNPDTIFDTENVQPINNDIIFGRDVIYENGLYTLVDTSSSLDNYHHYTCNNSSGVCSQVRYYYYYYGQDGGNFYVLIDDGRTIEEVIEDMLYADNVNRVNSIIKSRVDRFYEVSLIPYSEKIEDTIFCNDRGISNLGGWDPNGGSLKSNFSFNGYGQVTDLSCDIITDQFSINNNKAQLTYPVGLVTKSELDLINPSRIRRPEWNFWTMTPGYFASIYRNMYNLSFEGSYYYQPLSNGFDIRPVISLIPGIEYVTGDGSISNPYEVRDLYKNNINVDNDENKGIISGLSNVTDVEENSNVVFMIIPNEGYYIKNVYIWDSSNHSVDYVVNGNNYSFKMPGKNVTITTEYEIIKSKVSVQIVNETEAININIPDLTQVEYGEEVSFKITPVKGYTVNSVRIIDEYNNEIEFSVNSQNEYVFTMPADNVSIIPSYRRVSSSITVEDNKNTKEFVIEVGDVEAVVYEETVKITIVPEDGYELERLDIRDSYNHVIEYHKTKNKNEYEFVMPDSDVTIKPIYREIIDDVVNPKTGTNLLILLCVLLPLVIVTFIKKQREAKV